MQVTAGGTRLCQVVIKKRRIRKNELQSIFRTCTMKQRTRGWWTMKRRNGYLQLGLAVFLSVSAILLFYDTLFGRRVLPVFGGQLISAVQPVLIGALRFSSPSS